MAELSARPYLAGQRGLGSVPARRGSFMDSGQSTRTEPSASGWSCACPAEAARLPFSSARNATTSLRGRWGSARQLCGRPAPVPAGQAAPAPPHVGRGPGPGMLPALGETWTARPGCSREGYSQENRREGSPPSLSGSESVVHPRPPMRFGGMGTSRCLCWPSPGNSRAWSPPGARHPWASPPTAGEIRRTPRSLDPAVLGSSCCSFLHPTEPSGTQCQAG